MSGEREPLRLLDPASGASDAVRDVLASAGADAPTAAQLAALSSRMTPLLAAPAPAAAATSALPKLALAVGLTLVVGAGLLLLWPRGDRPAPQRTQPAATAPAPAAAPTPAAQPAPQPPVSEPPPPQASAPPPAPRTRPSQRLAPGAPDATTEMELLGAAHQALRAGTPQRALDLAREHETRFRSGTLVQEREAIAIEALVRLRRAAQAARRLDAFVQRFPTSSYRKRLENLIER